VRNSRVPVSVKLRAGMQKDLDFLLRFTKGLEDAGAAWITLHPRIGEQKRRGAADWSQIRFVRERLRIAVIGNGDVQCLEDVFAMLSQTGCDSVMIGRALLARPWLLWQLGEKLGFSAPPGLSHRHAPATPYEEGAEYGAAALHKLELLEKYFDFENGFKRFKFHLRMTCGWLEFGHALSASCSRAKNYSDLRATVLTFFSAQQKMYARTNLRE
jgi:tRNA-dihydrouridine synthase B